MQLHACLKENYLIFLSPHFPQLFGAQEFTLLELTLDKIASDTCTFTPSRKTLHGFEQKCPQLSCAHIYHNSYMGVHQSQTFHFPFPDHLSCIS